MAASAPLLLADPASGVSFAYLTNCLYPEPWHSERLDTVSNFVHMAILDGCKTGSC